jgi:hypothetical protein
MLTRKCQDFRRTYEAGRRDSHRETCDACGQFAELIDGLGQWGMRAPLGESLRRRLRDLPEGEERRTLAAPQLPMLPLPLALKQRLQQIGRTSKKVELPIWIRSPRFAIAASYLLTVLIGATIGNPAALASDAVARFDRVGIAIGSVESGGRRSWQGVEERAAEGFALTKEFYRTSSSSIKSRWQEFVTSINETETTDDTEAGEAETTRPEGE